MRHRSKQKCLKGVDLEVMYATLWSGNWQIVWGLLMFPVNWIPLPSPAIVTPPHAASAVHAASAASWLACCVPPSLA